MGGMSFKAAFFDIDNTLFDYSKMRFTPSALECIRRFQEKGGKAFIVSARCYDLIRSFGLFDLGVKWDGWSAFCGGITHIGHKCVNKLLVPVGLVKKMIDYCNAHGGRMEVLGLKNRVLTGTINRATVDYHNHYIQPYAPVGKYKGGEVVGCVIYAYEDFDEGFMKAFPEVTYHRYCDWAVDVSCHPHRNKGLACKTILDALGIGKDEAIAFGDDTPDIFMKDSCKELVIVGNGRDEAKARATYVAEPISDDGIAKAFAHFDI